MLNSIFKQLAKCLAAITLFTVAFTATAQNAPQVLLKTTAGDIVLELDAAKAPKTVENFLNYVKSGHYNGTIFHRVIGSFMIQGGGFDAKMREKSTQAPIQNEAKNGLKNNTYTIAMARTSAPHSATAQFFINVADNDALNYPSRDGWGYAVFGKVISGMQVVDKIKAVRTGRSGMYDDVPLEPVTILSATVIKS
jgi:peptidyl-prolyl cis-trans isomerase A (cyclophilin A)